MRSRALYSIHAFHNKKWVDSSMPSKVIQTNNIKEDHEELVSITEKINLTKKQYEVLNIICNTFEESISQYLQEALVEAMRFDIEEGNFCDTLLEKISSNYKTDNNDGGHCINNEKILSSR